MKRLSILAMSMAFAGTASAADIYNGWARGNLDLHPHNVEQAVAMQSARTGVQPGVGDASAGSGLDDRQAGLFSRSASETDIYNGWARGNLDLYPHNIEQAVAMQSARTGVQPGVGDASAGGGLYDRQAGQFSRSASDDKSFVPTIETFGL